MKLVFIHGRAQQGKDPEALQQQWEESFDKGLKNACLKRPNELEIGFPFYGDVLDQLINQVNAPLLAEVKERGADVSTEEIEFRGEFFSELAERAGLTQEEIEQYYEGKVREKGILNWEWVHSIMKALDNSTKLGDIVLDSFTRDVYVYLTKGVVQRRINAIVEQDISGDPCVVVGHSLGSVVGYNVLRSIPHKVVRYVTVGSPLGIKSIKRRLNPPLEMPSATTSWFNALDEGDFIALYPLNNVHFPIIPPIENKTDVDNTTNNQHGIIGYLPDPDVAKAIYEGLKMF
jgi:hypothetical protein